MSDLPRNAILVGDALRRLRELPADSVDTCITSPPYYQLRDYGVADQLGLESTVTEWVENLRRVLSEVGRILKPTGSLWVNLGDAYSRHATSGAPSKGLLLSPERLLVALAEDGWIVRNKVIWAKTNPMPESVGDRLAVTYDVVYFLVRSPSYYFDLDAIREPSSSSSRNPGNGMNRWLGKNPGDIWRLPVSNFRGAHFATFPEALILRPLLATCPEAICTDCGRPWRRPVTVQRVSLNQLNPPKATSDPHVRYFPTRWRTLRQVGVLEPDCESKAPTRPGVVLDPFFGSGTVGVVATKHGRDWVGIELNPEYAQLAGERLRVQRLRRVA